MRAMENAEYSFILKEIAKLTGNRFEKMQEIEKGKLSIKIGKERIVCELGTRMNIAYSLESGTSGNNFVQKVRKELKGARFSKVFQHNMDRVIVFEFERGEELKKIIFEMFGKGNSILIQDGKTVACYKWEKWADREIKSRAEYNFPKSNIVENLEDAISEKYIISCMMRLPLGKKYAKEILRRVGIEEKTPGNELKAVEIKKIKMEIEKMKKEFVPMGFYENKKIVDYGLVEFEEYKDLEKKRFGSLSEVADEYYGSPIQKKSGKIKKLEKRLEEQKKSLEELRKKGIEYKEIGDKIYEKYSEIEEILKEEKKKIEIEIEI